MGDERRMSLTRLSVLLGVYVVLPLAVISIVAWYPFYWPTLLVTASSDTADPSVGMPLAFAIEDEGVLNAHSVRYRCYVGHAETLNPRIIVDDGASPESQIADVLSRYDPIEISCPGVVSSSARVVAANVAVLVSFRPSFDCRRSFACGYYDLRKNAANQLAWFRKSSELCEKLTDCLDAREAERLKYTDAVRQAVTSGSPWPNAPATTSCVPKE
jgi:hypothetical protein